MSFALTPENQVPSSLKKAFIFHSIVDLAVGLPLMIAPKPILEHLGWETVDPVATRIAAAALLAGSYSIFSADQPLEGYKHALMVKSIWASAAIIGLLWSIKDGAPKATWGAMAVFVPFWALWNYWRIKLNALS